MPHKEAVETPNTIESLFDRIEFDESGCWLWKGSRNTVRGEPGYAVVSWNGKQKYVHRIVFEHVNGPFPDGTEADHVCRVKNCVNPDHIEAVTRSVNQRRIPLWTHCKRGHEFTEENTYRSSRGRFCRACREVRKSIA